jgi:hypothetical protein
MKAIANGDVKAVAPAERWAYVLPEVRRVAVFRRAIARCRPVDSITSQSVRLDDWLLWARAKADWLDPVILVSDPILDAPEPKRPSYW